MLNFFDCDNKKCRAILKVIGYTLIILSPIFLFGFIKWDILRAEHSLLEEESEGSVALLCFIVWIFFFILFNYKKEIKKLNKLIEAGVLNNKLTKEAVKKIPLNELEELKTLLEDYRESTSSKKWISSKIWWTTDHNIKIINTCIIDARKIKTKQKQPNTPQEELRVLVENGRLSPEFAANRVNKLALAFERELGDKEAADDFRKSMEGRTFKDYEDFVSQTDQVVAELDKEVYFVENIQKESSQEEDEKNDQILSDVVETIGRGEDIVEKAKELSDEHRDKLKVTLNETLKVADEQQAGIIQKAIDDLVKAEVEVEKVAIEKEVAKLKEA